MNTRSTAKHYQPGNDGKDHINVYGQGRTALGRSLSNFAHTPFVLDNVEFASVEAWWYYQSLIRQGQTGEVVVRLRSLFGSLAKNTGRKLHDYRTVSMVIAPTPSELKRVYHVKLQAQPLIAEALRASTLPFDHYYVFNNQPMRTKWQWTGVLWGEVREEIRNAKV